MLRFQRFTANTTIAGVISIGDSFMSMTEFACLAAYVLTSTDLGGDDDPRLELIRAVRGCTEIGGFNPSKRRIKLAKTSLSAVTPV